MSTFAHLGIAGKTWVWAYDDAGNILSKKEYAYTTGTLGSATSTITYGYGNTEWRDLLTSYNGKSFSYDTIGNLTSDGTWTFTWKNGRQLAAMENDSERWDFSYDASGMRTQRTDGSTTYKYTYEGTTLTQMTVGSNALIFTYGGSGLPLSVNFNGTDYYYVTNIQGDVVSILNSSGAEVVTYTYDAWGNILSTGGSMVSTLGTYNPLRYRGYVYDYEVGIYYVSSRYYNPEICRFTNADDVDLLGANGDFTSLNLFAYCGNNPVSRADSSGYLWLNVLIGTVVGAAAGIVGQVISDVVTSILNREVTISNWQTYTGATIGGAAGGVVLATTGNMNAANAVTGAVTTGVGQSLEKLTISDYNKSWAEIGANAVVDGAASYGLGKIPGIKGATAGRNSWSAVYKSGLTKLTNGTVTRMSAKVIAKGLGSSIVGGFALDGYYGIKQHAYDRVKGWLPYGAWHIK